MSIAKNLSWTFGSRMGAQFTQILFSVFLARLLTPAEYGLMGMLAVLSGFAQTISEAGLTSALIYLDKADDDTFSTAFWMQVASNMLFAILFFLGAGTIAQFYDSPMLKPVTEVMAITFVLQSMGAVQMAILSRQMKFSAIAIANYVAALASCVVSLLLALKGFGVWALVWQQICNLLVLLACTTIATRWYPRLRFSLPVVKQMVSYGSYLLFNNSINYWLRNGDNMLIGRVLGAQPLGIYNRAYSLMLLPLQNISAILGQVMFSTLSRKRDDMVEFRKLYIQSIRLIAFVAFPIMGGLSVLALPIIRLLYGPQWVEAAPVLQILSLVGLFQCIIFPVGWIYNSLGHNKDQFRATLMLTPPFILLIWYGMYYGLLGVTWGYAIWAVLSGLLNIYMAGRLIDLSVIHYLSLVIRKIVATLAMMACVKLAEPAIVATVGSAAGLVACILLGAIVYPLAMALLRDPDLAALLGQTRRMAMTTLRRRSA